jgi:hypothetical protein
MGARAAAPRSGATAHRGDAPRRCTASLHLSYGSRRRAANAHTRRTSNCNPNAPPERGRANDAASAPEALPLRALRPAYSVLRTPYCVLRPAYSNPRTHGLVGPPPARRSRIAAEQWESRFLPAGAPHPPADDGRPTTYCVLRIAYCVLSVCRVLGAHRGFSPQSAVRSALKNPTRPVAQVGRVIPLHDPGRRRATTACDLLPRPLHL